eukprot:jgi/Undpi1/117/HiC_scaffold_1.g00117.m1
MLEDITASGPQPLSTLPSPGGGAADASSSATPGAQAPPTPSSAGAAGESGGAAGESSSAAPGAQAPPTPSSAGAAGASSSAAPGTQVQPTSVGGSRDAAALVDTASFGSWDADNSTRDGAAPGDPDVQHEETVQQLEALAKRVYMCVPEYICPAVGLPDCPHCEDNEQVVSNGWEPGSRLVHAEHDNYYVIAFQYKCKTCAGEGYYFHLGFLRQSRQPFLDPAVQAAVEHPECLGKFDDKDGYNGNPPGEATLRAAWHLVSEEGGAWFQRRAQMVGGKILAGDASYKFTKKIKVDGNRIFSGSYTLMNEHHMVVMQFERRLGQQQLLFPRPPSWTRARASRLFRFPAGKTPMVIQPANDDCTILSHAIAQLLEEAKPATDEDVPGMVSALGFDAEWEVWTSGARPIATVQLTTGVGTTIIFHVKYRPGGKKQVFSKALRAVLEREDILKVGVGVNSDFGRLVNDCVVNAKAGMDLAVASRRYLSRSFLGTGSLSSL